MGIVDTAKSYLGKVKYVFGANDLDGGKADCSSFVQSVYKKNGITIGRTTALQWQDGQYVEKENLQAGDLVFFHSTYNSNYVDNVSHVGIYIGNDEFIHCSSGAGTVTTNKLSESYYQNHYLGGKTYGTVSESSSTSSSENSSWSDEKISAWFKEKVTSVVQPIGVVLLCGVLVVGGVLFLVATVKESGVKL